MPGELAIFQFRHSADIKSVNEIKEWCRKWGKAWVFQKEKGDTGYIHYQGRISLIKKRTIAAAKNIMKEDGFLPQYFEPESNNCKAGTEAFYVTKHDTRIEGPWSDQDKIIYVPRQYRGLLEKLYPWQQKIWDQFDEFDDRYINIVYDPIGKRGKSTLRSLAMLYKNGYRIPPENDGLKVIQSVCNMLMGKQDHQPGPLFLDLPRSMNQDELYGLYKSIEMIKDGPVYDLRNHYKEWWYDSPQIWVFCNTLPKKSYVSADRWVLWTIKKKHLIPYQLTEICTELNRNFQAASLE